jgi:alkanesulfonate monooxygenase SsuD/methylene tetrahydromethanopterin reductase-like flavin-dependent oxidoreductase (luciferase family)
MNVGLYFDLRDPPAWRQGWSRTYGFALEMCEEAEHLGAHSIWLSEHHLFEDGYLPQPLTFAAAVAARTNLVRIGTAIVVAPFRHPVHLAEEAAIVDAISGGRLDLGLGAGYRAPEFALFGADPASRYRQTEALVRDLRRIWAEGAVTPPPLQSPLPVWLGYNGPSGARRAGRLGERLLSANPALAAPYRQGLAEAGHPLTSARMAGHLPAYVTDDPDADWPVVARHHAYQWDSYSRYHAEGTDRAAPRPIDPERSRERGLTSGPGDLLYATPDDAAPQIAAYLSGSPVETVFLWASLAGMPQEMVARNIRTICTRLAPLLAGCK